MDTCMYLYVSVKCWILFIEFYDLNVLIVSYLIVPSACPDDDTFMSKHAAINGAYLLWFLVLIVCDGDDI